MQQLNRLSLGALLSAPMLVSQSLRSLPLARRCVSGSVSDSTGGRTWSGGLLRWALGSGVILAGAAAVRRLDSSCSCFGIEADGDAAANEAAIRRAFRSRLLGSDCTVRLSRVSYSRLEELVATDRIDEVHICTADSALYALEATSTGAYRCYAVKADCNGKRCEVERLADQLVDFRQRLAKADAERGFEKPVPNPPLRLVWCSGPVLAGLAPMPDTQLSLATLLTPATVGCISAWAGVCLRWRAIYLAAPIVLIFSVPVLILRDQK